MDVFHADLAIVGAGPAGLATALEAQRRGLRVWVMDHRSGVLDKACGEGVMPAGYAALQRLGVARYLASSELHPFTSIRYVQEDGVSVEGQLPSPGGMGIRRVALSQAFRQTAWAAGIPVVEGCQAQALHVDTRGVTLSTSQGDKYVQLVVGADGLHSWVRRAAQLNAPISGTGWWRRAGRFGLRQHFEMDDIPSYVEVHFERGIEAYVTPSGRHRLAVAFLWEDGRVAPPKSFQALLALFPALAARLKDARPDSSPLGAGPLRQRARARVADRVALVGDAAGYVDALTGEGLSLAFRTAAVLGEVLPSALKQNATRQSLLPYARRAAALFRPYAFWANTLLLISRHPRLRRQVLRFFSHRPAGFEYLLQHTVESGMGDGALSEPLTA